jgi:hypothetical protein
MEGNSKKNDNSKSKQKINCKKLGKLAVSFD